MQRAARVELSLRRLSRLAALEREYGRQLNPAGLRLLRASTFSVYCDCRALGMADRAGLILDQRRRSEGSAVVPADLAAAAGV